MILLKRLRYNAGSNPAAGTNKGQMGKEKVYREILEFFTDDGRVLLVDPDWEPQIVKDYDGDKTAILLKRVQKIKH
jgi:hypothetical protein